LCAFNAYLKQLEASDLYIGVKKMRPVKAGFITLFFSGLGVGRSWKGSWSGCPVRENPVREQ
jgi:hypothetical protein